MKKIIYLFTLFALSISLTIAHAASPTYDDEPPSYIWGSGGLNAQTSGTPNKNSDEKQVDILRDVNVRIGSITVDTGTIKTDVASLSSNLANAILSGSTVEQEISIDTSNIESYLKKVDGDNTITITDLINGIGTDTKNIETNVASISSNMTNSISDVLKSLLSKTVVTTTTIYDLVNSIKSAISTYPWQINNRVFDIHQVVKNIQERTVPTFWATTRKSISPNTTTLLSDLRGSIGATYYDDMGRVCIEIRCIDPDAEFYIGFRDDMDDTTGRPVKGRILLNVQDGCNVYIYHTGASSLAIQQTEGWSQSTL